MGKKRTKGGAIGKKVPSFLAGGEKAQKTQDKPKVEAKGVQDSESSSEEEIVEEKFDRQDPPKNIDSDDDIRDNPEKKREFKKKQKLRVQESRELGLPTGITGDDIDKFKSLLEKHGDKI